MALKPACDVFDSTYDVRKFRLVLIEMEADGTMDPGRIVHEVQGDLCPRGVDRAKGKMDAAFKPSRRSRRAPARNEVANAG